MKIYLQKAIFVNKAPFEGKLDLDFHENEISVLSGINGKGKTTILSHIVDAYHEITRPHFKGDYAGKESKFYRISSSVHNIDSNKPSYVYLRFKLDKEFIDYLDIRNECTEDQYNEAILLEEKIPFNEIKEKLINDKFVKKVSSNLNKNKTIELFSQNILTYFPSYRYEQPGYLNEPYHINIDFNKYLKYSGYLPNPLEVISGLPNLVNRIMDMILDNQYLNLQPEEIKKALRSLKFGTDLNNKNLAHYIISVNNIIINQKSELQKNVNYILTETLSSKGYGKVRIGIGERNSGGTRIQVMKEDGESVYPSIFNISSGESALLCIFGELLKQADNNHKNTSFKKITGVVLIDEIDKHLHIKLQKEALPNLLNLFPNVQFIVSSHSPFLSMGLAESATDRAKIIDLDSGGISVEPTSNELYTEVYELMISENERFKVKYEELEEIVQSGTTPLIITEGKTDVQHIKNAHKKLDLSDLEIDFYEITEDRGQSNLKTLLTQLSKVPQGRKIIGIFDRDDNTLIDEIEKDGQTFKDWGNNVYAFCIPLINKADYGEKISIEHYYPEEVLKKEDQNGRRLFLGNEFHISGNSKDGKYQTRTKKIQNKVENNGIIDDKVYEIEDFEHKTNVALPKSNFSKLINENDFTKEFDFKTFIPLFERIRKIINKVIE